MKFNLPEFLTAAQATLTHRDIEEDARIRKQIAEQQRRLHDQYSKLALALYALQASHRDSLNESHSSR